MLLLASSVCGLFKWRQFEPEVILLAVGWYLRFSLSYRDVEELLAERGADCDHSFDRPTTVGGWTKPTSGLRGSGCIYTGLWTLPVRRSTSFCRLKGSLALSAASSLLLIFP